MGCDIHSRVEVRRNGAWEAVGPAFPYQHDEWVHQRLNGEEAWRSPRGRERARMRREAKRPIRMSRDILSSRSYLLFSVLAGVRAQAGAGEPISAPRGLPPDVAMHFEDSWRTYLPGPGPHPYDFGEHSFSWLSLWEIVAHDWPVECREDFASFFQRMQLLLALIVPSESLREAAPLMTMAFEGDKASIDVLEEWLADRGLLSLEDVRIVFGFDG